MCNKCIRIIQMMHDLVPDTGSIHHNSDGVAETVIHAISVEAATRFTKTQSDRMMQKLGIPPQFQMASDRAIIDAFGDVLQSILEDYAVPLAYWFGREEHGTFAPMRKEVKRMNEAPPVDEQAEEKFHRLLALVQTKLDELTRNLHEVDPELKIEVVHLGGVGNEEAPPATDLDLAVWLDEDGA